MLQCVKEEVVLMPGVGIIDWVWNRIRARSEKGCGVEGGSGIWISDHPCEKQPAGKVLTKGGEVTSTL